MGALWLLLQLRLLSERSLLLVQPFVLVVYLLYLRSQVPVQLLKPQVQLLLLAVLLLSQYCFQPGGEVPGKQQLPHLKGRLAALPRLAHAARRAPYPLDLFGQALPLFRNLPRLVVEASRVRRRLPAHPRR